MGRFATTVALYEELRPPYPPCFLSRGRATARARQAARADRPRDRARAAGARLRPLCRPHRRRRSGAGHARRREERGCERASQAFTLIAGKAEDLPDDIGSFDVVTIGRALHWMDREADACAPRAAGGARRRDPRLRILLRHRRTATRGSTTTTPRGAPGRSKAVVGGGQAAGEPIGILPAFSAARGFTPADVIRVETSHQISVRDLARRVLTFSSSSPEVLGDKAEAMLRDVEQHLASLEPRRPYRRGRGRRTAQQVKR